VTDNPRDSRKAQTGGFLRDLRRKFADVSTAESQFRDLTAEEFPEGPYGMSLETESLGKSEPWHAGQRSPNPFGYENRELHEGMTRAYPADHDPGDAR